MASSLPPSLTNPKSELPYTTGQEGFELLSSSPPSCHRVKTPPGFFYTLTPYLGSWGGVFIVLLFLSSYSLDNLVM
jgi:hypothetical protein